MSLYLYVRIGFHVQSEIHGYYFILQDGDVIPGTNTPNETMARRWLSLYMQPAAIDKIITDAQLIEKLNGGYQT